MDDIISRQAVLDGLANIAKAKAKSNPQKAMMGRSMFFIERLPSVQPEQRFSRSDVFEILHKIKAECWNCGMNMEGEYQGAWTRFRDIEKIIDKYMQKMEEGE